VEIIQPCCQLNFVSREEFLPFLTGGGSLQAAPHISRGYRDACGFFCSFGRSHLISGRLACFLLESEEEQVADGVVRIQLSRIHEETFPNTWASVEKR
jgi:hypothetical protein